LADDITYRTLFDALPIPGLVVDADMQIRDLNQAAAEFCGEDKAGLRMRRGGEVLHCIHVLDAPAECGRGPHCATCVMRNVVSQCLDGGTVRRRRSRLHLGQGTQCRLVEFLVTASPVPGTQSEPLALLMLEDITEMSILKDIVPICMNCKKIRDDEQLWHDIEGYFRRYAGVDFSHGVCPACRQQLFPELEDQPIR
jgi:PAS domain-containing protein